MGNWKGENTKSIYVELCRNQRAFCKIKLKSEKKSYFSSIIEVSNRTDDGKYVDLSISKHLNALILKIFIPSK